MPIVMLGNVGGCLCTTLETRGSVYGVNAKAKVGEASLL